MKVRLLPILLFFITSSLFAQSKADKWLKIADTYFANQEYAKAVTYYEKAYRKTKEYEPLKGLSKSYFFLKDIDMAEYWYNQLIQNSEATLNDYHNYTRVLMRNEKYQEAKNTLKSYASDSVSKFLLQSCDSAMVWMNKKSDYAIENLKPINSHYSDFGGVFYMDSNIVFSSSREGLLIEKKYGQIQEPFYDLFISHYEDEKWSNPVPFSLQINSSHHEATPSFSDDFKQVYFTRSYEYTGERADYGNTNRLKIYRSEKKKNTWSTPAEFVYNDSIHSYAHPTLSADGKIFFFASDRAGGYGGYDIYICVQKDSSWSEPLNLGPTINTPADELYPFFHPDQTLYFSSDGHYGMGGQDIFSTRFIKGKWAIPQNLGSPINSSMDDYSLFLNTDKSKGILSSNRKGGKGADDLYLLVK